MIKVKGQRKSNYINVHGFSDCSLTIIIKTEDLNMLCAYEHKANQGGDMANISDVIEAFLLDTLGDDDSLSISRNELANYFSCAPSQINYVLSTRFTPERGYIIESRRGGGGSITVVRLSQPPHEMLEELIGQTIAEGLGYNRACQILDRLEDEKLITDRESQILKVSLSDKALIAPSIAKDGLRAGIMKSVILYLLKSN